MSNQAEADSQKRNQITNRLRQLLCQLLAVRSEANQDAAIDQISADVSFTELGINSVDFLEFVLAVEREFDMDIADEAFTEHALFTLTAWTDYLAGQITE